MSILERKKRERKTKHEAILAAAVELAQRDGIQALTMRGCAEAIEYSPCVIYQHFAGKDEIIKAMFHEVCDELVEELNKIENHGSPEERLVRVFNRDIEFMLEHSYRLEVFTLLIGGISRQEYPKAMIKIADLFADCIKDLKYPQLETKPQIDEALDILRALLSGVLQMGSLGKSQDSIIHAQTLMEKGIRTLLKGWK